MKLHYKKKLEIYLHHGNRRWSNVISYLFGQVDLVIDGRCLDMRERY